MPVREVLQLGHPLLRQAARAVEDFADPEARAQLLGLAQDLGDTLADCRARTGYGRAIAAPQIGTLVRMVVVRLTPKDTAQAFVNPEVTARSDSVFELWDACLSSLDVFGRVRRHTWIEMRWRDLDGEPHEGRFDDARSELLQHELDHLDGVLYLDRVEDSRTLCSRTEFERRHRQGSPYAEGNA